MQQLSEFHTLITGVVKKGLKNLRTIEGIIELLSYRLAIFSQTAIQTDKTNRGISITL